MAFGQERTYPASCPSCNNSVEVSNPRPGRKPTIVTHVAIRAREGRHEIETAYCDECDHSFPVYFQYSR
jgi:hypothetical protein